MPVKIKHYFKIHLNLIELKQAKGYIIVELKPVWRYVISQQELNYYRKMYITVKKTQHATIN
jgi:hypothetical protein